MDDLSELWQSACYDTPGYDGLEVFKDGSEPGKSNASRPNGDEDLSEFLDQYHSVEEVERGDHNTVQVHGAFSPGPMGSQTSQGVSSMDAFHTSLDLATRSPPYQEATQRCKTPLEENGAQFRPGSMTDPESSPDHLNVQLPRVVVSDTTLHNVGNDEKCAVSEPYAGTSPTSSHFDAEQIPPQDLEKSHKLVTPRGNSTQFSDVNWYHPSNYEVAMHDRQQSYAAIEISEPEFGTLTAGNVDAFNADADSIKAQVATPSTPGNNFGVKTRRPPKNLPTLQIPARTPPGSQHRGSSLGNVEDIPNLPKSLQATIYPTPPSSRHRQRGSGYGSNDQPSTPTSPLCINSTDLSSPVSPSPSSLSDVTDNITCCPSCPDKIFRGSHQDRKNNLQRHWRDCHKDLLRLPCLSPGCPATFAPGRKDNRIRHVRAMHPDYPLPAPSTKRKRRADSDLESS